MPSETGAEGGRVSKRIFTVTVVALVVLVAAVGVFSYNQIVSDAAQIRELQNSYDQLQSSFDQLQSQLNSLEADLSEAASRYDVLLSDHNALLASPGLTYDITDYGAVPDDGGDDAMAFEQILSAHPSDVRIRVPRGTFLIGTAIYLRGSDNVTIFGEGTGSILKLVSRGNILRIENSDNVMIIDLALDGNSEQITGTEECVRAGFYADNLVLRRVYIHDAVGNGVHVFASSNTFIDNCRVENTGQVGIDSRNSGHAIVLNSVDGARIANNVIEGFFGDTGIGVFSGIPGFLGGNAVICNNTISGAHTDEAAGIGLGGAENCIIVNNVIFDDEYLYDSMHDVFQGISGIFMMGEKNVVVNNNEVYGVSGVGIEINNGNNVIAINNHVHDFVGNGTNAQGIFISADNTLVENNTIEDATNHGILTGGDAGINIQIINNIIKDTRGVNHADSAGIRIILDTGDKKYLTIRDNTLINNPYGLYLSGPGHLVDSEITGNIVIGSEVPYFGVTQTS